MINTDVNERGEIYQAFVNRQDGTIRQLIVQTASGKVLGRGYFAPGTIRDEAGQWKSKVKYHWTDAFTNEELSREFSFSEKEIKEYREASESANSLKVFVHKT